MTTGKHNVLWRPLNEPGLEHLVLSLNETGVDTDGFVIGVDKGRPFRLQYRIEMDSAWTVHLVAARVWNPEMRELILESDGKRNWSRNEIDGCIDPDISVTPLTNTIPIRRLKLQTGQSTELLVAYIKIPELKISAVPQRYTCLEQMSNGTLYRYEGLSTGFTAEMRVDELGLVVEYSNVWTRVNF